MKHKGLRQYTGDEASNLSMSMLGWDICNVDDDVAVEFTVPSGVEYWCAIKILSDNVELQAKSHPDFSTVDINPTGEYDHSQDERIKCTHGDVIYGCFTKVSLAGISDVTNDATIQLIRGK